MTFYPFHDVGAQRPDGLVRLLHRSLAEATAEVRRRASDLRRRLAFQRVVHLDDRMLDDIGLTREEVSWANGLPLHMNASHEAHTAARLRRERERRRPHQPRGSIRRR